MEKTALAMKNWEGLAKQPVAGGWRGAAGARGNEGIRNQDPDCTGGGGGDGGRGTELIKTEG